MKNKHIIYKNLIMMVFLVVSLLLLSSIHSVTAQSSTEVHIIPQTQIVTANKNFTIDIYVKPAQPIKGVELKLSFDPLLLQANKVKQGNLFEGCNTFFSAGTIDNTNGTIEDVYDLIVGTGNVTQPGTFATVFFTAKHAKGVSSLHPYDVGVSNETRYVDVVVYDGNIEIEEATHPSSNQSQHTTITPPSKPSGASYGFRNITYFYSTSIKDSCDSRFYYLFDWGDGTNSGWLGPLKSNETCTAFHSWNETGEYDIKVKIRDIYGNESSWSPTLVVMIQNTIQAMDNQTENIIPAVNFYYSPDKPTNKDTIQFIDQSIDSDGDVTKWLWDFGDGNTSDEQNPTHRYDSSRSYIVTLMVWDNNGTMNVTSEQIKILPGMSDVPEYMNKNGGTPDLSIVTILAVTGIFVLFIRRFKC